MYFLFTSFESLFIYPHVCHHVFFMYGQILILFYVTSINVFLFTSFKSLFIYPHMMCHFVFFMYGQILIVFISPYKYKCICFISLLIIYHFVFTPNVSSCFFMYGQILCSFIIVVLNYIYHTHSLIVIMANTNRTNPNVGPPRCSNRAAGKPPTARPSISDSQNHRGKRKDPPEFIPLQATVQRGTHRKDLPHLPHGPLIAIHPHKPPPWEPRGGDNLPPEDSCSRRKLSGSGQRLKKALLSKIWTKIDILTSLPNRP
jgi:hypothetical protein